MEPLERTRLKLVDSNEPWIIRGKLLETGWEQRSLPCGDYSFWTRDYKRVGFERKTVNDFLASLGQRLASQLDRMILYYDYPSLLLEGNWRHVKGSIITNRGIEQYVWSAAWNFIRSWQHRGVMVEITTDEGHTIQRLNELYAYYQRISHTGGVGKGTVGDTRVLAIASCDGIGLKLGESILKHFGCLRNIANASVGQLSEVEKIGSKKAEAIFRQFNKEV